MQRSALQKQTVSENYACVLVRPCDGMMLMADITCDLVM